MYLAKNAYKNVENYYFSKETSPEKLIEFWLDLISLSERIEKLSKQGEESIIIPHEEIPEQIDITHDLKPYLAKYDYDVYEDAWWNLHILWGGCFAYREGKLISTLTWD